MQITSFLRAAMQGPIDGKYEIVSRLGAGGMGEVYKARHVHLDALRVIKVMRREMAGDSDFDERFAREAKMATRVNHPNVATLHDFSRFADGSFYMVFEYIEGTNLADVLANERLTLRRAARIAIQALRGLDAVHAAGIVHRDISPDNLILARDGRGAEVVKLIDLGTAKHSEGGNDQTQAGVFIGKWRYCSPEHLGMMKEDERIDGRADIYSFGIVLYEMITGTPPFRGNSPQDYIRQHAREAPRPLKEVNPTLPEAPELEAIIFRALAKNRTERYQTAAEFADALEQVLPKIQDESVPTRETFVPTVRTTLPSTKPATSPSSPLEQPTPRPTPLPSDDPTMVVTPLPQAIPPLPAATSTRSSMPVAEVPPGGTIPINPPIAQPQRSNNSLPLVIIAVALVVIAGAAVVYLIPQLLKSKEAAANQAAVTSTSPSAATGVQTTTSSGALTATSSSGTESIPQSTILPTSTGTIPVTGTTPNSTVTVSGQRPPREVAPPTTTTTVATATTAEVEPVEVTPQEQSTQTTAQEQGKMRGLLNRFAHRGGSSSYTSSSEYTSPTHKGMLPSPELLQKGDEVTWQWVARGTTLSSHHIDVGNVSLLVSAPSSVAASLRSHLQDELNGVTGDATESTLTAQVAIVWADGTSGRKGGLTVEIAFRDGRTLVGMARHTENGRSLDDVAGAAAEAIANFVQEN